MRVLFVFLLLCTSIGRSQSGSDLFPAERRAALREELVYEPEVQDPPDVPTPDFSLDLSNLRDPLVIGIAAVLLLGLGLLIYRILGDLETGRRGDRQEATATAVAAHEIVEEELVAGGVSESLLERAEAAGQYDVAVRLHYIALLKSLQDAAKLRYRKDYSNRDYRQQLRGDALLPDFTRLVATYERFWFGKYPIDRLSYRVVRQDFTALAARISPATNAYAPS